MAENFRDRLFNIVSDYINQQGHSPFFGEITHIMGLSPRSKSLITRSLRLLEKEGRLTLNKVGRHLLISLSPKHIPLLGRISAGLPIEAITESQFIDMDQLFSGLDRFALQVKGTSMIEEGIWDEDIIICKKADTANEGDIIVALIDQNNVTLKKISYKAKGVITLVPANAELKPHTYFPERIQVQGIYIGLLRTNR
jgi:SOS regulatory protein LexA